MRVTLVGGGKVGSFLARELHETDHVVTVIEEAHIHAQALSDESEVLGLEGDGKAAGIVVAAESREKGWLSQYRRLPRRESQ